MGITPFATVEDLRLRWPGFPVGGDETAKVLLDDATQYIIDVCPSAVEASENTKTRIACAVVRRAMQAQATGIDGYSQVSETAGPFSTSFTAANPNGDIYLTQKEIEALGGGRRQKVRSIEIEGSSGGLNHRPWCSLAWKSTYCSCGADLTLDYPLWEA